MESPKTVEWTLNEDAKTQDYLQQVPERGWIKEKLQAASDYENYGLPVQKGERLFFLMRNKGEALGNLTVQEKDGSIRTLVRAAMHAPLSAFKASDDGSLVTYGVSEAGADKQVWKFLNVETGQLLEDEIEGIQFSTPVWSKDQKGVYYIHYEKRAIYYHELGAKEDSLIHRVEDSSEKLLFGLAGPLLFSVKEGQSHDNAVYLLSLDTKKVEEIVPFGKGNYTYIGQLEEKLLFLTNDGADRKKIVAYDAKWSDFIPEDSFALVEAEIVQGEIFCHYLKDCSSILKRFDRSGQFLQEVPLPGKGSIGLASESPFFAYTDMTTPQTIYHYDQGVHFQPTYEGPRGRYVTKQLFFSSKDGTRVPLFITHRKGIKLTGDHPTLLYGYGGFNASITPYYSPLVTTWVEMGGIFVSVNLRGGGEYGKEWHEAGILDKKQNVFDDFIASAEFLIKQGYTQPSRLAINGRSNGGLLVGACLTQRPDLFGAAIPQVGVLDMLKFHQFTIGWAWVSDYGNPDDPEHFPYLYAYSPYHNIKKGASYPPTLITTSDHDDRVVPLHSYKFAARLQEAQGENKNPILLRVYTNTGHGRGRSSSQELEERTDILSFLAKVFNLEIANRSPLP